MWQVKTFDHLSAKELHMIYQLRSAVFIVEQNCAYQDIEAVDLEAIHLLYLNSGLRAYGRIVIWPEEVRIGRIVVAPSARGQGLGQSLVRRLVAQALALGPVVTISAQQYLDRFYRELGFELVSGVYLEDGIPHQKMVYRGPSLGINET